jgi:hypothetical protein
MPSRVEAVEAVEAVLMEELVGADENNQSR